MAALVIDSSLSSSTPLPSSSTHLCLMAKGEQKVQNDDDSRVMIMLAMMKVVVIVMKNLNHLLMMIL